MSSQSDRKSDTSIIFNKSIFSFLAICCCSKCGIKLVRKKRKCIHLANFYKGYKSNILWSMLLLWNIRPLSILETKIKWLNILGSIWELKILLQNFISLHVSGHLLMALHVNNNIRTYFLNLYVGAKEINVFENNGQYGKIHLLSSFNSCPSLIFKCDLKSSDFVRWYKEYSSGLIWLTYKNWRV